jgi:hypothetical protein
MTAAMIIALLSAIAGVGFAGREMFAGRRELKMFREKAGLEKYALDTQQRALKSQEERKRAMLLSTLKELGAQAGRDRGWDVEKAAMGMEGEAQDQRLAMLMQFVSTMGQESKNILEAGQGLTGPMSLYLSRR